MIDKKEMLDYISPTTPLFDTIKLHNLATEKFKTEHNSATSNMAGGLKRCIKAMEAW